MKTILVHIEGDEGQGARLQAAFDLARGFGGHVLCLSVMPYAAYALGDPAMGAFPVTTLIEAGASRRPNGLLVESAHIADASLALTAAGLGPVTVSRPDFVFDVSCAPFDTLRSRVFDATVKT